MKARIVDSTHLPGPGRTFLTAIIADIMATAIATKPTAPHQKIKRPPPPLVQTNPIGANGFSQPSPLPSISSKRPPSGFKHPPITNAVNGVNGPVNGGGPRISNRRRESHKPGDPQGRPIRSGKGLHSEGFVLDRKSIKRMPEPYGTPTYTSAFCTLSS